MTIKSGLEEGEIVVLNPRGFPDKLALPEVLDEKQVTAKIPPKSPPPEGKEKPKVPPPSDPPGPRPAAPGGAS
jgi:hypothetical protein